MALSGVHAGNTLPLFFNLCRPLLGKGTYAGVPGTRTWTSFGVTTVSSTEPVDLACCLGQSRRTRHGMSVGTAGRSCKPSTQACGVNSEWGRSVPKW